MCEYKKKRECNQCVNSCGDKNWTKYKSKQKTEKEW